MRLLLLSLLLSFLVALVLAVHTEEENPAEDQRPVVKQKKGLEGLPSEVIDQILSYVELPYPQLSLSPYRAAKDSDDFNSVGRTAKTFLAHLKGRFDTLWNYPELKDICGRESLLNVGDSLYYTPAVNPSRGAYVGQISQCIRKLLSLKLLGQRAEKRVVMVITPFFWSHLIEAGEEGVLEQYTKSIKSKLSWISSFYIEDLRDDTMLQKLRQISGVTENLKDNKGKYAWIYRAQHIELESAEMMHKCKVPAIPKIQSITVYAHPDDLATCTRYHLLPEAAVYHFSAGMDGRPGCRVRALNRLRPAELRSDPPLSPVSPVSASVSTFSLGIRNAGDFEVVVKYNGLKKIDVDKIIENKQSGTEPGYSTIFPIEEPTASDFLRLVFARRRVANEVRRVPYQKFEGIPDHYAFYFHIGYRDHDDYERTGGYIHPELLSEDMFPELVDEAKERLKWLGVVLPDGNLDCHTFSEITLDEDVFHFHKTTIHNSK